MGNELEESQRHELLLSAAYAQQTRLVTNDSEKSIQYDMLKHDVDTNRQIYEVMLQRVKESSITSALKAANVLVIDPAKAPTAPLYAESTAECHRRIDAGPDVRRGRVHHPQ